MTTTVFSFEYSSSSSERKKIIAVLKALGVKNVSFQEKELPSDLSQLIEEGRKDLKEGKTKTVTAKNIWDSIK